MKSNTENDMASFDNFITSLRTEFGEQDAGKKFEVFCKWFLENDPEWSKTVDKVWLWDEYPNKWQRQDLGTDLVFRDSKGLIWAVQAKCYGEHRKTTKGDMNSFLADTGRKEVDRRLWLQSTNKMEAKAEKTLKGQDKPVTVFKLNNFRDAQIDYPSSFSDLYQAKVKAKPTPDVHQLEAIEAVQSRLQTVDRGQMIMACGTGKTFTTLWIKEALEAHTTLVLLPSLSLLSQTMREWAWAGNTDFDILNVCSDKSVGKKTEDMNPYDAPFPVTSEVEEIAKFLKQPKPKVVFCTYQSSDLIAQAQLDGSVPAFDLAVADEAHRCAGKADAGFATILDDEKIRASKRLFTTATPRYFGKAIKDAAKARDLAVVGMDNEAVFGPVIHKLTFGQAIEQELLTDYQVVIVGVDEPMVREWIENYEIVSTNPDNATDARTLAAKIGMLKAVKDYDLKRVISFHSRVAGAKQFSDELVDVAHLIEPGNRPEGTFLSDYVSGAMKAGDRKDKIDRLKVLEGYDRGILTNARCLAEGVDVPSLDGVAFIDPRGSQVEIIQAVGRAIRKVRGAKVQKKGTIVLPVFIEDGDDHEASIEASNFKPVWGVLKALRAHDEVLADTLDEYRTNMAKNASQSRESISNKIIFDLPVSVDAEFSSALRTILVEASTESWAFWFGLLKKFREIEGHCRVPQKFKSEGFQLGPWVSQQRAKQDSMTPKRKQKLDAIDFVWNSFSEWWEEGFNKLIQFIGTEGHCNVPRSFKLEGHRLGLWVGTQRANQVSLSPKRKQRLNDIGFIWDPSAEKWDEGFNKLLQFKEIEGHCRVPKYFKLNEFKLGEWVSIQRKKPVNLTPKHKQRLDDIGFAWSSLDQKWWEHFDKLLQFKEIEGHCNVPLRFELEDFKLGRWVGMQRTKQDSLPPEYKQRLNDTGFIWDPLAEQWEEGFSALLQFNELESHCKVVISFELDGFKLGNWVSAQRRNKDRLSTERKQRLDDLGFVWDLKEGKPNDQ
jgi:superfamily II DNA or RNA helicase